jgi:hypothetical protein
MRNAPNPKDAVFYVPNTKIPLNNRPKGVVAGVAVNQLKTYQERAANWPMFRVRRDGRDLYACQLCEQSLFFYSDEEEQPFVYSDDELLALKVAHIRQNHDKDGTNDGKRQD